MLGGSKSSSCVFQCAGGRKLGDHEESEIELDIHNSRRAELDDDDHRTMYYVDASFFTDARFDIVP